MNLRALKVRSGVLAFIFALIQCAALADSKTNRQFKTERNWKGDLEGASTWENRDVYSMAMNWESLPAEEFSEGNWGPVTNGVQVSARVIGAFGTNTTFGANALVPLVILWRNISVGPREMPVFAPYNLNYPVELTLKRDGTVLTPRIPRLNSRELDGSTAPGVLNAKGQCRILLALEKIYDLSQPGEYEVIAGASVSVDGKRMHARSGTAKFTILAKLAPAASSATNSLPEKSESRN